MAADEEKKSLNKQKINFFSKVNLFKKFSTSDEKNLETEENQMAAGEEKIPLNKQEIKFFSKVNLFEKLSPFDKKKLAQYFYVRQFKAGEVVF